MSSYCKSKVFPTRKGIVRIACSEAKNGMHFAIGLALKSGFEKTGKKLGVNGSGRTCDEAIEKVEKLLDGMGYVNQGIVAAPRPAAQPANQPATVTETTPKAVPATGNAGKPPACCK